MVMSQQQVHREYIQVTSSLVQDQCIRVPQTLPVQHTVGYKNNHRDFGFRIDKNLYLPHQVLSIESVEKYCPKPKSASLTLPFSSNRTFSVFKSLCIGYSQSTKPCRLFEFRHLYAISCEQYYQHGHVQLHLGFQKIYHELYLLVIVFRRQFYQIILPFHTAP